MIWTYLACMAASLALHRLWNHEDIFAPLRQRVHHIKPLSCSACNAFWASVPVAVAAQLAGALSWQAAASLPFVAYIPLRVAAWVYLQPWHLLAVWLQRQVTLPPRPPVAVPAVSAVPSVPAASAAPAAPGAPLPPPLPAAVAGAACGPCAAKQEAAQAEAKRVSQYQERVVLLTALADFDPSYSLVTVILDQARMLARNPKRLVQLWVMEGARINTLPALPPNVEVHARVPAGNWKRDVVDGAHEDRLVSALTHHLLHLGNASIITHDLLLVSDYLTFAAAIHKIGAIQAFKWVHVIHSCLGPRPEDPKVAALRATLPKHHVLAIQHPDELPHAERYYQIDATRVVVIPNARDPRSFGTFSPLAAEIMDKTQCHLWDYAQVFPVSSPRMSAKGVETAAKVLRSLETDGRKAGLIVADAHATGAEAVARKAALRQGCGLERLYFTSDILPKTAGVGLPGDAVRDLLSTTNLFIFPSLSEATGLVVLEAALAGNVLVLSEDLPVTPTLDGVVHAAFPTSRNFHSPRGLHGDDLIDGIEHAVQRNSALALRRHVLARRCWEAVAPSLEAALLKARAIPG